MSNVGEIELFANYVNVSIGAHILTLEAPVAMKDFDLGRLEVYALTAWTSMKCEQQSFNG